jgi:hypothetical protein
MKGLERKSEHYSYDAPALRLVNTSTGKPLKLGDAVETFRGERAILLGIAEPHKPASTGRVYIQFDGTTYAREFFPSVIGAEWVNA